MEVCESAAPPVHVEPMLLGRRLAAPASFAPSARVRVLGLVAGDVFAVLGSTALALLATILLREWLGLPVYEHAVHREAVIGVGFIPLATILWFSFHWGHYTRIKPFWSETRDLLSMIVYSVALIGVLTFVTKTHFSRLWLAGAFAAMVVLCPLTRWLVKHQLARLGRWHVPLVVVGDVGSVATCSHAIASDATLGYRVAACVELRNYPGDAVPDAQRESLETVLSELAATYRDARLLIAVDKHDRLTEQQHLVDVAIKHFKHLIVSRPMHGLSVVNAEVLCIDKYDTLFVRLGPNGIGLARGSLKRMIDVTVSTGALLVLSPLLLLLAALVRRDGGKAFYASERIGCNGQRFRCHKFRSMCVDSEAVLRRLLDDSPETRAEWYTSFKLRCDPRVTPVGAFLRRTSLDELPQLWNVLRGDMSLVGPRPILPDEIGVYGARLTQYQDVRPGLTGLWQISGRGDLDYQDRIALNLWYVRNWSLWLDFTVLLRTLRVPFRTADTW